MEIKSIEEYRQQFPTGDNNKLAEARLEKIFDIRKFEIELYWKRATYFWTFIGATLAGYGYLVTNKNKDYLQESFQFEFLLICLGLVFSVAWYLVNKASKYWFLNWEKHLDISEDEVFGPLYKTTIHRKTYSSFFNPTEPYSASVSNINQILSLFVLLVWLSLLLNLFFSGKVILVFSRIDCQLTVIGMITCFIISYMIYGSSKKSSDKSIIHFLKREVKPKSDEIEKQGIMTGEKEKVEQLNTPN